MQNLAKVIYEPHGTGGERVDEERTREILEKHGSVRKSAKVTAISVPPAFRKPILDARAEAVSFFKENTAPFGRRGHEGVCRVINALTVKRGLEAREKRVLELVAELGPRWGEVEAEAQRLHSGAWRPELLPSFEEFQKGHWAEVKIRAFDSVPTIIMEAADADAAAEMEEERVKLQAELKAAQDATVEGVLKVLGDLLTGVKLFEESAIKKAADPKVRLSGFHYTRILRVSQLTKSLRKLNLTDDPRIDEAVDDLDAVLGTLGFEDASAGPLAVVEAEAATLAIKKEPEVLGYVKGEVERITSRLERVLK